MAEFECWPLWQDVDRGRVNIDPGLVGLPAALVDDLNTWADRFDTTYGLEDPSASGFPDSRAEDAFYAEGLRLAGRVAQALGATVAYYDGRSHETREVSPSDQDTWDSGA
ncbi:MAG: hypothetical protein M3306_00880 [Actinomycetota bacterium]|nr:hypothetical protein [Actinomycetota bacterium]